MKRTLTIRISATCLLLVLLATHMQVSTGCANIIPPEGGPKDSLPPKLLKVVPAENALNVTDRRITMSFDEYVQLENAGENLVISPTPKSLPDVRSQLRTVTVRLKDSLEPNTTYTIDFGDAIRDVNESNVLKNFRFVFSTGATIDSLELKGKVLLAETGQVDSTLIVMLYRSTTDSAVAKEKPRYYTKLNGNGEFRFRNLPPGNFSIYTIKDEGGQKKYGSPAQLFGFFNSPVNAVKPEPITLFAYVEEVETPRPAAASPAADARLRVQNSLEGGTQDILEDLRLNFNRAVKTIDTTKLQFTDTLGNPVAAYSLVLDSAKKRATLKHNWNPGAAYRLIIQKEFAVDDKGVALVRADTIRFTAKTAKDYGRVKIKFEKLNLADNPVLQLVQSAVVVQSYVLTADKLTIPLLKPGEYELRLLADDNKNGKWDAGNFFTGKRQPEKAARLSQKLNVRADWDNELDIR